jgi:hypothetical protein
MLWGRPNGTDEFRLDTGREVRTGTKQRRSIIPQLKGEE